MIGTLQLQYRLKCTIWMAVACGAISVLQHPFHLLDPIIALGIAAASVSVCLAAFFVFATVRCSACKNSLAQGDIYCDNCGVKLSTPSRYTECSQCKMSAIPKKHQRVLLPERPGQFFAPRNGLFRYCRGCGARV